MSVILLSIVAALFATVVFLRSASADHNTLDNLITFVVTILSMLVAVLAYHISVKTYISIDAVNAISKMDGNVIPVEVKSGRRVNSKSLKEYMDKYKPAYGIRISTKNFGLENNIKSVPLYAVFCIYGKI